MTTIDKLHTDKVMPLVKAENLVELLNKDQDDDCYYSVLRIGGGLAKVKVYDENDVFVGVL